MDNSAMRPDPGGGGGASASPHTPKPHEAKKHFEFFPVGARREVLMLGDPVELRMHWHAAKKHKVLCTSETGVCRLCEMAATDQHIDTWVSDYGIACFVRPWRESEFSQKVAVLPRAATESLTTELFPDGCRGMILHAVREPSKRMKLKALQGIPRNFPAVLPAEFPILPWLRARYGLPQHPTQPLVYLKPIRCEASGTAPAARAGRLGLTKADAVSDTPDEAEAFLLNAYAKGEADPDCRFLPPARVTACEDVLRAAGRTVPPRPAWVAAKFPKADAPPAAAPPAEEVPAELARLVNRSRADARPRDAVGTLADAVGQHLNGKGLHHNGPTAELTAAAAAREPAKIPAYVAGGHDRVPLPQPAVITPAVKGTHLRVSLVRPDGTEESAPVVISNQGGPLAVQAPAPPPPQLSIFRPDEQAEPEQPSQEQQPEAGTDARPAADTKGRVKAAHQARLDELRQQPIGQLSESQAKQVGRTAEFQEHQAEKEKRKRKRPAHQPEPTAEAEPVAPPAVEPEKPKARKGRAKKGGAS